MDDERWESFADDELRALWDGLTLDDGIRCSVEPDDEPAFALAEGLFMEAERRDLVESDPAAWRGLLFRRGDRGA